MGDRGPTFQARTVRLLDSDSAHDEVRVEVGVDALKFFVFKLTFGQVRTLARSLLIEIEE